MAYVHFRCLERWLNYASRDSCELCTCQFNVVLNRRYTFLQSVRVWVRHPTNRTFILCDLMIGMVLTVLTFTLVIVCLFGLNHFVTDQEGQVDTFQSYWGEGVIDLFLVVLLAGYLITMYSMVRDHVRPWYTWWKRCNNVRLILEKNAASTEQPAAQQNQIILSSVNVETVKQNNTVCKTSIVSVNKESCVNISVVEKDSDKEVEILNIKSDNENITQVIKGPEWPNLINEFTPSTSHGVNNVKTNLETMV